MGSYLIIIKTFIIGILIAILVGCAATPRKDCPPGNRYYWVQHPRVPFPMMMKIDKGFFNEENKDKWRTEKGYQEWRNDLIRRNNESCLKN